VEKLFVYLLGAESIAFCLSILIVIRWSKKLTMHLSAYHQQFLEENLSAPFWAGDSAVMKQHIRAVRNAYFGTMPDSTSAFFQKRMRSYAALSLLLLLLFAVTLIAGAVIFISAKD
jgi:hypothetical protein